MKSIFELSNKINVCGEAENGNEVLEQVNKLSVDVVLMDINMPSMDGVETTKNLKKLHPHIKVLSFSMYDDNQKVMSALKAGADGYLLKSASREEIFEAIDAVSRGQQYIMKEIIDSFIHYKDATEKDQAEEPEVEYNDLSAREVEILKLMAQDNSYKEIAKKLNISKRTVDTHRYNISKKLGIKSIAGLIKYAMAKNIS